MKGLAKLGFAQSYTYFTWRTAKWELEQYLGELTRYPERDFYRPNLFVNTPDILPYHLQSGETWMFKSRVALAATLSGNYGVYSGFELLEHERDSRPRGISRIPRNTRSSCATGTGPATSRPTSRELNRIRNENAALQQTGNLRFLGIEDGKTIAFVKEAVDPANTVVGGDRAVARRARILVAARRRHGRRRRRSAAMSSAVENLITGEQYPHRMGRDPIAYRSRRAIPRCCSAAWRKGARHECIVFRSTPRKPRLPRSCDELWYKDAIIYQLHVKAFADSNNDGIGDFAGLTEKLDYLQELGVTALWLLPFYPSPGRDDGYDIADYGDDQSRFRDDEGFQALHPGSARSAACASSPNSSSITPPTSTTGSSAPAAAIRARARATGMSGATPTRNIRARGSSSPTPRSRTGPGIRRPAQFYWHRFFSHQPDLNFDNPRVVSALVQVMKRWLDTGVDGFRLDAIPYLCERDGTNNENLPETHAIIKRLRHELDAYAKGKVLLAEANQWPEDVQEYFGRGDECHMAYHFPLMPRIYMAIAQEDRFPITDILRQTPDIPATANGRCSCATTTS